jgi:type IV secretory pathway VirD2 relaxase
LAGKGLGAARAHLRYIERDGVSRDGEAGCAYSANGDRVDANAFLERSSGDRHQFRLIASAEDGSEYDDLKPLVRRFMAEMEKDLGTRLDWVAVDHLDTGHPHTHIVLRGRDDRNANLVIARDYIAHGMRERLAQLVTLDLGPRLEREVRRKLLREVGAERLTSIDRGLIGSADGQAIVAAGHRDPFRHALRAGRLKKLEALGLAEPLGNARWRLSGKLEQQLRRLGERGDIIRTMQRELKARGLERKPAQRVIHEAGLPRGGITGRLVARGLADEHSDRHFLLVDGVDGRVHRVDIGRANSVEPLPEGSLIKLAGEGQDHRRSGRFHVELLSPLRLDQLPRHEGATWLDRLFVENGELPIRDSGFGHELRTALSARRQWLLEQDLAHESAEGFRCRPTMLETLRQRELAGTAARLSREMGLSFAAADDGEPLHGLLKARLDLASGRFALLVTEREFMLVPWSPALERHIGKDVSGIARGNAVNWALGRARGSPEVG